jgi:hypothetical protein
MLHIFTCYIKTWQSRRIRLLEDDAGAPKHAGVLTMCKILLIYIYVVHLLVWIIKCYIGVLAKFI